MDSVVLNQYTLGISIWEREITLPWNFTWGKRACWLIWPALAEKKDLRIYGKCCLSRPAPGTTCSQEKVTSCPMPNHKGMIALEELTVFYHLVGKELVPQEEKIFLLFAFIDILIN